MSYRQQEGGLTSGSTVEQQPATVLRLRPPETTETTKSNKKKKKPRVRWTEDVIDNEHLDKKKSKICCIFHPQREFGELSSESSSDSSSDSSDSESEGNNNNNKNNNNEPCCDHGHSHKRGKKTKKKEKVARPSSPNAYEKQPQYTNKSVVPKTNDM